MKIFIGADHRGFEKKSTILKFLHKKGTESEDLGVYAASSDDDFNDPAISVAKAVRRDVDARGILICGSAHGMVMQANRFLGIRAITATEPELIKLGREHNNANVLCLSADFLSDDQARQLVEIFIDTKFDGIERHARRNARLDERKDYD